MSTSADTTPISPTRFAAALKDLSISMLHLKVLEIRNSIAHLQYSNDQLKPFAEGTAVALSSSSSPTTTATAASAPGPDQDCIEAIRENEQVIDRMAERIALIQVEVETRGLSWAEFQSMDEVESKKDEGLNGETTNNHAPAGAEGEGEGEGERAHAAWADGTFQTGTISNGEVRMDAQPGRREGGTLSDEQIQQQMEERMRNLDTDDDGGIHL